jgi:site-specific recombinase XerD
MYLRCAEDFAKHYMRSPEELGELEVRCYILHQIRVKELSADGVRMYVAALKFLYETTLRKPEVVTQLPWPKVSRKLPDILSASEIARLLEAVTPPFQRAIVTTMYATGMRISEVTRLRIEDVDGERKVIHIRQGKRGKDRFVMAGDTLLECLREYYRAARPQGPYLFPGQMPGQPITTQAVREAVKRAIRKAGITKNVTPHLLRHSFASHLLEHGSDIRTIQFLLGHSSIRSTVKYTQVTPQLVASAGCPLDQIPVPNASGATVTAEETSPKQKRPRSPARKTKRKQRRARVIDRSSTAATRKKGGADKKRKKHLGR